MEMVANKTPKKPKFVNIFQKEKQKKTFRAPLQGRNGIFMSWKRCDVGLPAQSPQPQSTIQKSDSKRAVLPGPVQMDHCMGPAQVLQRFHQQRPFGFDGKERNSAWGRNNKNTIFLLSLFYFFVFFVCLTIDPPD